MRPASLCKILAAILGALLLATILLIAGAYLMVDLWGQHEWNSTRAAMEAKGEKLDIRSFIPPVVPRDQNFFGSPMWDELTDLVDSKADVFPTRIPRLPKDQLRTRRLGDALGSDAHATFSHLNKDRHGYSSRWNLADLARSYEAKGLATAPPGTAPGEVILQVLSKVDPFYAELRDDARRPNSFFPLPYSDPTDALPHLSPLIWIAQVLSIRSSAEASLGYGDAALADVSVVLRLAKALRNEPMLIIQLVANSIEEQAALSVWQGISYGCWKADQLKELEQRLAEANPRAGILLALRGKRAVFTEDVESAAAGPGLAGLRKKWFPPKDLVNQWPLPIIDFYPRGLLYDDLAYYAGFNQRMIDRIQNHATVHSRQWVDQESTNASRFTLLPVRLFSAGTVLAVAALESKLLETEARLAEARVACVLEQIRLSTGSYPASLAGLPNLPPDPIDGHPLRYRKESDGGYCLWSIGLDEIDQNGETWNSTSDLGDWTWSMPLPSAR